MKIKKLKITQFRGIKDLELEFCEELNVLSGKNSVGKTTILDAIMWVLTDETLVYGKQSADNRNQSNLRDVIKVELEFSNGLVLERTYFDRFKEDSTGELRYDKLVNEFRINGAKYSSKEYFEYLKYNVVKLDRNFLVPKDYNLLRSLIDYNYFGSVDYKVSRALLEKVLDLKTDEEILNCEKYKPLLIDMQVLKFDIQKVIAKYKNLCHDCDSNIEAQEQFVLNNEKSIDLEKVAEFEALEKQRNEVFSTKIENNAEYLAYNRVLEEISKTIKGEQEKALETKFGLEQELMALVKEGNLINSKLADIESKKQSNRFAIDTTNKQISANEALIEQLSKEHVKEQKCPNCEFVLNQNAIDKAQQENDDSIKSYKAEIDKLKGQINDVFIVDLNNLRTLEAELGAKKSELGEQYFSKKEQLTKIEEEIKHNEKVVELEQKQEQTKVEMREYQQKFELEKAKKFEEINEKLNDIQSIKAKADMIESMKEKIKALKREKANAEILIDLAKTFKSEKLKMIKDNLANIFPTLDIEIIEENENTGSQKEVCYLKLKNVEYKGINDGHRKLIGITFIENLKKKLNLEDLPIIFDKYADIDEEQLSNIVKTTNSQIIVTQVSNDKELNLNTYSNIRKEV